MVFAFFAAADKAAGAVNNFKSSTVHNNLVTQDDHLTAGAWAAPDMKRKNTRR